jgi:ABC-type amino acid transport substrate-binding protein
MNHNSQLKDPVDQALIALEKSGAIAFLTKKWFN